MLIDGDLGTFRGVVIEEGAKLTALLLRKRIEGDPGPVRGVVLE
jgi:hypothetical protein